MRISVQFYGAGPQPCEYWSRPSGYKPNDLMPDRPGACMVSSACTGTDFPSNHFRQLSLTGHNKRANATALRASNSDWG